MREHKVVQKWECKKCDVTVDAPIPYSSSYCRLGHKMKLIEGDLPKARK